MNDKSLGGLWAAHRKTIPLLYCAKHTFTVSETSSQKGKSIKFKEVSIRIFSMKFPNHQIKIH